MNAGHVQRLYAYPEDTLTCVHLNIKFISLQFDDSLHASWLMVNAQVRRMFAAADGKPDLAEWQEGR